MTSESTSTSEAQGYQLPWTAIPKFIPGSTDVTEYSKKLQFLAAMWPKESIALLAPRAALLCEGSAFKKVSSLPADKLKSSDDSGVKLLVATLGGSWGRTDVEVKYDTFERAIFGTVQKSDETNDSYLARHDIHFEELLALGVTLPEIRAYILLRQSSLSPEDRKKIVVEMGGSLDFKKVCASIRLLGSRFFADLQGQKGTYKTKTYDAHMVEEAGPEDTERAYQASASAAPPAPVEEPEGDLDAEYVEAMVAAEDQDALQIQAFEEELEGFFQDTPELQEALVSYLEARSRLLAKRKARGFWPIASGQKGAKGSKGFKGKGKGKNAREQLLLRISKSNCRICGERGHWKAECPKLGRGGAKNEATTTVAEVTGSATGEHLDDEIHTQLPAEAVSLAEAHCAIHKPEKNPTLEIRENLCRMVNNLKTRRKTLNPTSRPACSGEARWTEPYKPKPLSLHREAICQEALATQAPARVDAILDTGASRCVLGRNLVPTLLSQLCDRVRSQVRVVKSSVRFRFGNNQTLLSEQRILMPIRTIGRQVLWLGLEVVPGSTPLLFSKRAIKQLGGIIDTNEDDCQFVRLQKHVPLQTSATGLYLLDLARLCEESCLESECHHTSEDSSKPKPVDEPCMSVRSTKDCLETPSCIAEPASHRTFVSSNSTSFRFRKYPECANDKPLESQEPKGGDPNQQPVKELLESAKVNATAVIASTSPIQEPVPRPSVSQHGQQLNSRARQESGNALRSSERWFHQRVAGRSSGHAFGPTGAGDRVFRHKGSRPHLRGRSPSRRPAG